MKRLLFILFVSILNLQISTARPEIKEKPMQKQTIAIYLDGVLDNYTGYTEEIPDIKEGAKEFIGKLSKNYDLILFTNRSPKKATEWLIKYNLEKYFKDVTNVKPIAAIYIDDRSINFKGDYNNTLKEINDFKVWWKE